MVRLTVSVGTVPLGPVKTRCLHVFILLRFQVEQIPCLPLSRQKRCHLAKCFGAIVCGLVTYVS